MMNDEESVRNELSSIISDLFKDMNGVRPRHIDFANMPIEKLQQYADQLQAEYEVFDFNDFYGPEYGKPREDEPLTPEQILALQQQASDEEIGHDEPHDLLPKHIGMGKLGKMGESMKITEQELKALIGEAVAKKMASLTEAKGEPGTDVPNGKAVAEFVMDFSSHINKMVEETKALADKGEALIETNLLNHPEVGTRNELLIQHVGMLRSISNSLATVHERIRRFGG